jgi:hypothetical protein
MSEPELEVIVENAPGGAPPLSPSVGDRVGETKMVGNAAELRQCKPAELCHHVMESGMYCQSPALRDRRYCYSHLRLRGERMRMARAIAKRLPYRLMLPELDDIASVRVAAARVADALAAGLLEPQRAGRLVYTFQHISSALRWEAQARSNPTLSPKPGDNHPDEGKSGPRWGPRSGGAPADMQGGASDDRVGQQARLVEEYPGFEVEYGLPARLDLSQPPHVVFPPPERTWPSAVAAGNAAQAVTYNDPPPSCTRWTKEAIEMEELDKRRESMDEKSYCEQSRKIHGRIENQVKTQMRKEQEAEWQAEADRRNAFEEKKAQIYRNMDDGQRQAYHLGILEGIESAQREAEEQALKKKPAAKAAVGS